MVAFDQKSSLIAKQMQTTGSPTKILGTGEENEQLFIIQGTTIIIEANSFNIDLHSQNPTAVTDQASHITLDQSNF